MLTSRKDIFEKLALDINHYSPVVIQGESGIGKSFFVRKLYGRLRKNGTIKDCKACYAWEFIDSMIEALCKKRMVDWKKEYLTADMIVIDDFQYIQGKVSTAEELYQIFSSVKTPIIITTSLPICAEYFPNNDLVQLLNGGTYIQLNSPSHEDIEEFLRQQIKEYNLHLSPKAYIWLTEQKINTFTMAKGIIKTLQLYCNCSDNITLIDCQQLIKHLLHTEKEKI